MPKRLQAACKGRNEHFNFIGAHMRTVDTYNGGGSSSSALQVIDPVARNGNGRRIRWVGTDALYCRSADRVCVSCRITQCMNDI